MCEPARQRGTRGIISCCWNESFIRLFIMRARTCSCIMNFIRRWQTDVLNIFQSQRSKISHFTRFHAVKETAAAIVVQESLVNVFSSQRSEVSRFTRFHAVKETATSIGVQESLQSSLSQEKRSADPAGCQLWISRKEIQGVFLSVNPKTDFRSKNGFRVPFDKSKSGFLIW